MSMLPTGALRISSALTSRPIESYRIDFLLEWSMRRDLNQTHCIDLKAEFSDAEGVKFDPDRVTLEGYYADELSPFRAKRIWTEILETNFLLDSGHDFSMHVEQKSDSDQNAYVLVCKFLTACARYAFWRITNNQAPEAQYLIETAHIPDCETRRDEFATAPDLRLKDEDQMPAVLGGWADRYSAENSRFSSWLRRLFGK